MTIENIKKHPLYLQLTAKQQTFVVEYISTQDRVKSIMAAGYNSKHSRAAYMLGSKNLRHPIIKQLIAMGLGYAPHGGKLSKSDLLLLLSEQIRTCKNSTQFFNMANLFTMLSGWFNANQVPSIQDAITIMEKKRNSWANNAKRER